MNKEYLLTPVIEVEDGNVLKSFQVRYMFILAFLFGLLPTLVLCIRNCLWLRVNRVAIALMLVVSILALIIKFFVLGLYYDANIKQLNEIKNIHTQNYSQKILEKSQNANTSKKTETNPVISGWNNLKSKVIMFERIFSLLLLFVAYQLHKNNYKIILYLTGNLQPMSKWAIFSIIAAVLFENLLSQLLFGGNL